MNITLCEGNLIIKESDLAKKCKEQQNYFFSKSEEEQKNLLSQYALEIVSLQTKFTKNMKRIYSKPVYTYNELEAKRKEYVEKASMEGASPIDKYPYPKAIRNYSTKEKKERATVFHDYQEEIFKKLVEHKAKLELITTLNGNGRQLARQTRSLLCGKSGSGAYEETAKNFNIYRNGTIEEKKAFMEEKFREIIDYAKKFDGKILTDREIVKEATENYDKFSLMFELQNPAVFEADFGVGMDAKLKNELLQMKDVIVNLGCAKTFLGVVSSPEYMEYDPFSVEQFAKSIEFTYSDNDDNPQLDVMLNELKDDLRSDLNKGDTDVSEIIEAATSDEVVDVIPSSIKDNNTSMEFYRDVRRGMISRNMELQYFPESVSFKDLKGNVYDKETAINEIASGKIVDACDKDGNVLKRYDELSIIKQELGPTQIFDLHLDSITTNGVRNIAETLKDEIKGTTRMFMRSSDEYKKFRTAINDFAKLSNDQMGDKAFVYNELSKIATLADKYLAKKEEINVEITKNTEPRIAFASKVSSMLHQSLTKVNERKLEKENVESYKNFKDNISLMKSSDSKETTVFGKGVTEVITDQAEKGRLDARYETGYVGQNKASDFLEDDEDLMDMVENIDNAQSINRVKIEIETEEKNFQELDIDDDIDLDLSSISSKDEEPIFSKDDSELE